MKIFTLLILLSIFFTASSMSQDITPNENNFEPQAVMTVCTDKYETVEQRLKKFFQETTEYVGILNGETLLQITTSEEGSFTLIAVSPSGRTCIIGSGQSFVRVPKKPLMKGIEN